jgi:methyltransferase (TIGR00027 family)
MKRESDDAIADTAHWIACAKYEGNKLSGWKNPKKPESPTLFKGGDYMALFVNEEGRKMLDKTVQSFPKAIALSTMRHKYMNQVLSRSVKRSENPVTQVIILGSGFDTRPVQKKKYDVKFFEVDKSEILAKKAAIYKQNNIDHNSIYIQMDYVNENLIDRLKKAGVEFDTSTHFIWEGNTAYLPNETIYQIIDILKKNFSNTTISFDYFSPQALTDKKTGSWTLDQTKTYLKSKNAEFVGSIEDIHAFAKEHQLTLIENHKMVDLLKIYRPDEEPDKTADIYSLCTVKLGRA